MSQVGGKYESEQKKFFFLIPPSEVKTSAASMLRLTDLFEALFLYVLLHATPISIRSVHSFL